MQAKLLLSGVATLLAAAGTAACNDPMSWPDAASNVPPPWIDGSTPGGWPDARPQTIFDANCAEVSFPATETQESYAVPANVGYMLVKAWGAGGNGEGQCSFIDAGIGGYSEAVFAVNPGDLLVIIVGKAGHADATPQDMMRFGFGVEGGGGLSGVFRGPGLLSASDYDKAYVIAGGGGGGGVGPVGDRCRPGGTGNHPQAGGRPDMQGGMGLDDGVNGGGGGYRGGAGGPVREAGKGGTGYVDPSATYSRMLYVEPGAGLPPETDDPDYDGIAGKEESSGLVVMQFTCTPPVID